jgi:hypothetical protein
MDDFNISTLQGSKNEWCCYLIQVLTPLIMDGYKSILNEAIGICKKNDENEKYLMTFQNYISRVPKWNQTIIDSEVKRICEKSGCSYLEELITCVHIIQLKMITAMRVGQKQKKISISIPKLQDFIHKVYTNTARKLYKNIYLYELGIPPLQSQKNNREIEMIIQNVILETVRESIPIEEFLKIYLDETIEEDISEEIKEEIIDEPIEETVLKEEQEKEKEKGKGQINNVIQTPTPSINIETDNTNNNTNNNTSIKFNDIDQVRDTNNIESTIEAPKTIDRLEQISEERNRIRKEEEDEEENEKIKILDEPITLNNLDIHNLDEPKIDLIPDLLVDDIEVLT